MSRRGLLGGGVTDELYDFREEPLIIEDSAPFILTASNVGSNEMPVTNTTLAVAQFRIKRAGIITGMAVVADTNMVANGTNFLTFTAINLQTAADGNRSPLSTTAHVNTTDANAASLNGGTTLSAKVIYDLTLTATTASLYVKEGDLIRVVATATQSPAAVDLPRCFLKYRCLPMGLKPTVFHTGGATTDVPIAIRAASTSYGEALLQLTATNEIQSVRLDKGDQVMIDPTKSPTVSFRLKISDKAAVNRMVWGLCSAYNATWDSTTNNAWFRIEGNSFALLTETDDDTTNTDDQATGVTLVADTYAVYTIDFNAESSKIYFSVNGTPTSTVHDTGVFAATHLMQPIVAIQKDSGTAALAVTVDYCRLEYARY